MRWGLSGAPVSASLPYADACNRAAIQANAPPRALYAIAWRETIATERSGWLAATFGAGTTAANVISPDGGRGIMQLTAEFPANWADPFTNFLFGAKEFFDPYVADWVARGFTGSSLLKLAADDFNAGDRRVLLWHNAGNADGATTGGDYGSDVCIIYANLILGRDPDAGRP